MEEQSASLRLEESIMDDLEKKKEYIDDNIQLKKKQENELVDSDTKNLIFIKLE